MGVFAIAGVITYVEITKKWSLFNLNQATILKVQKRLHGILRPTRLQLHRLPLRRLLEKGCYPINASNQDKLTCLRIRRHITAQCYWGPILREKGHLRRLHNTCEVETDKVMYITLHQVKYPHPTRKKRKYNHLVFIGKILPDTRF